jgi:hypothetical protein
MTPKELSKHITEYEERMLTAGKEQGYSLLLTHSILDLQNGDIMTGSCTSITDNFLIGNAYMALGAQIYL